MERPMIVAVTASLRSELETSSTLADTGATLAATGATLAATGATLAATGPGPSTSAAPTRVSTVLPRVDAKEGMVRLIADERTRYATERVLGEGGMGVVDLARDHDIDRPVAIKRIRREAAGDLGVARFVEE